MDDNDLADRMSVEEEMINEKDVMTLSIEEAGSFNLLQDEAVLASDMPQSPISSAEEEVDDALDYEIDNTAIEDGLITHGDPLKPSLIVKLRLSRNSKRGSRKASQIALTPSGRARVPYGTGIKAKRAAKKREEVSQGITTTKPTMGPDGESRREAPRPKGGIESKTSSGGVIVGGKMKGRTINPQAALTKDERRLTLNSQKLAGIPAANSVRPIDKSGRKCRRWTKVKRKDMRTFGSNGFTWSTSVWRGDPKFTMQPSQEVYVWKASADVEI